MKSNGLNTGQTLGWFSRLRCSGRFLLCRTQRFAPGLEGLGLGFILCPYLAAILSILNAKTTIIHLCCKCLKINCRNGTHLVATLFVPFRQGPPSSCSSYSSSSLSSSPRSPSCSPGPPPLPL